MFNFTLDTALKTVIAYFILLILSRIMGRKMISQLTFFDFLVGVIVGSVITNMAINKNHPFSSGLIILMVLTIIIVCIDFANIKSIVSRKAINSEPVVVIENGKIVEENMKKIRLPLCNLMMLLREKDAFNINDVEFALLETDGKLSVLKKSQKQPATPSDLKVNTSYVGLTKEIIVDGEILEENLVSSNLDKVWLLGKLNEQNLSSEKEVFFAALDTAGNLYVSPKRNNSEREGMHGIE